MGGNPRRWIVVLTVVGVWATELGSGPLLAQTHPAPVLEAANTLKLLPPQGQPESSPATTSSAPKTAAQPGSEKTSEPLSLEHFQRLAWQHNPTLVQKRLELQRIQGLLLQAGLLPNPQIGYQGQEIGNEGRAGQQGAFIQQTYRRRIKLYWAQEVQRFALQVAQAELEAQQQRVLTDVEVAYVQTAINQRRVQVALQLVRSAEETVRVTRLLEKAQEVSSADVLRAEAQLYQSQVELYRARQDEQASWRMLQAVVGLANLPRGTLELPPQAGKAHWTWETLVKYLDQENPLLRQAELRAQQAYAQWQLQLALGLQDPQFSGSVAYDHGSGDAIAGVQISIPIPIYNWNQGNAMAARARYLAVLRERQRLSLLLRQQLAGVYAQYLAAAREVELYRTQIVPRWRKAYELLRLGYQQGEFQYTDVLQAQMTYFQAQRQALDAMLRWHTAAAQIQGLLLQGSLSVDP